MDKLFYKILFSTKESTGMLLAIFGCLIALFQWLYSGYVIKIVPFFFFLFISISVIYILFKALYDSVMGTSVNPKIVKIIASYDSESNLTMRLVLARSDRFQHRLAVSLYYKDDLEIAIGNGYVETITEEGLIQVIVTTIGLSLSSDDYTKILTPSEYCLDKYIVKPFLIA